MAFFGATIETVENVLQHPNADRLSIAKLKGLAFNVVIGLNQYLKGESVQEASNGKSLYGDTLREGVVIKPLNEEIVENFGRLIIKQRSPQYLSGSDN